MMDPSFLAPAATQNDASLLMLSRRTVGGAAMLRNTRAFRSFQIVHVVSMVSEAMAFRLGTEASVNPSHHSKVECLRGQVEVSMWMSCSHALTKPHRRMVKRHLKKRWSTDSFSRMHKGHEPQLGQPRLAKRSAVQTLFWMASQAKNLTLGGAQIFHTACSKGERMSLRNCAL